MRIVHLLMVLIVSLMLTLTGCGGGGGGSDSGSNSGGTTSNSLTTSATFLAGNEIIVATEIIDDSGGTITIAGTGTYLDGAQITFPPGAVQSPTEITIGYNDGNVVFPEGISSSSETPTITIHADGITEFLHPVEITLLYTDENNTPVPFYVDENGQLRAVVVKNIDPINKTLTFITSHTSLWTWVVDIVTDTLNEDSGFRPTDDGFQIVNYGSTINNGGECFGMTTFSQWYYDEKMESYGKFYDKYMNIVGVDSNQRNLTGQDVIATRAHSASNQSWNYYIYILPNILTPDTYRYSQIITALNLTKRPVILSLKRVDQNGDFLGGHSVLAYAANVDNGKLLIYDPNYPGDESKEIIYNFSNNKFEQYGNYTEFFLNGTGTYFLDESFENILEDAEHDFTTDNMPHIAITSHQNGETVSSRNITLSGTVESSEVLITQMDVFVGNDKFSSNVAEDGSFSLGVSLQVGANLLRFVTKGMVGEQLTEITPNNMDTNPFTINVDLDIAVMHVTLTWDKDDTDLDLYVIDPQGDYSAYYHMITADGGELDYDVTTGYGPEHWTLSSSDTIRWDQNAYIVRVHYYSDHGNGGTNYRLAVKLYEGTSREVEYVKTGYLSANDPYNDGPTGTGLDWAEFTMPIILTSPDGGTTASTLRTLEANTQIIPLDVKTHVPSEDIRRSLKNK